MEPCGERSREFGNSHGESKRKRVRRLKWKTERVGREKRRREDGEEARKVRNYVGGSKEGMKTEERQSV